MLGSWPRRKNILRCMSRDRRPRIFFFSLSLSRVTSVWVWKLFIYTSTLLAKFGRVWCTVLILPFGSSCTSCGLVSLESTYQPRSWRYHAHQKVSQHISTIQSLSIHLHLLSPRLRWLKQRRPHQSSAQLGPTLARLVRSQEKLKSFPLAGRGNSTGVSTTGVSTACQWHSCTGGPVKHH